MDNSHLIAASSSGLWRLCIIFLPCQGAVAGRHRSSLVARCQPFGPPRCNSVRPCPQGSAVTPRTWISIRSTPTLATVIFEATKSSGYADAPLSSHRLRIIALSTISSARPGQCDTGLARSMLKGERHLGRDADFGCLARLPQGQKAAGPLIVVRLAGKCAHRACINATIDGAGHHPAIGNFDGHLSRCGEQAGTNRSYRF
jgi:hypothetical protein